VFVRARAIAGHSIRKAALPDLDAAFRIVEEYYDAANVVARDTKQEFQHYYFGERSGVWLASQENNVVGCIALRELPEIQRSAEIKRMYVQPAHRGSGIAKQLLDALEHLRQCRLRMALPRFRAGHGHRRSLYQRNGFQPCAPYNHNPQANIYLRKRTR